MDPQQLFITTACDRIGRFERLLSELRDQRDRLEQLHSERQQGLVEHRLAEALLDALDEFEAAEVIKP